MTEAAIIIPALNEARTIAAVVESARSHGIIIVVDDGSEDDTAVLAASAGAIVVRHEVNRGYDAALASGLAAAARVGAAAMVTFDADGQHDPVVLEQVLGPLLDGTAELVLGVRRRPARVSEAAFGLYGWLRFGVSDLLCGLKGFSTTLYERHRALADTPSVNTALALAGLRDGARHVVVEVPIRAREGRPRFGSAFRANVRILRALTAAVRLDTRRRSPREA